MNGPLNKAMFGGYVCMRTFTSMYLYFENSTLVIALKQRITLCICI